MSAGRHGSGRHNLPGFPERREFPNSRERKTWNRFSIRSPERELTEGKCQGLTIVSTISPSVLDMRMLQSASFVRVPQIPVAIGLGKMEREFKDERGRFRTRPGGFGEKIGIRNPRGMAWRRRMLGLRIEGKARRIYRCRVLGSGASGAIAGGPTQPAGLRTRNMNGGGSLDGFRPG